MSTEQGRAGTGQAIHPGTRIGHVHLTVSDLQRSTEFYEQALGFEITARYGDSAVFLSAGGYHHHIGLNTWAGKGAPRPARGTTGLYHFAILMPSRLELARALARLLEHKITLDGAADHGVSEALYLHDPDGNGIEIYADRSQDEWPRVDGNLSMTVDPLDLEALLAEL